jgi:hypothetical protein
VIFETMVFRKSAANGPAADQAAAKMTVVDQLEGRTAPGRPIGDHRLRRQHQRSPQHGDRLLRADINVAGCLARKPEGAQRS